MLDDIETEMLRLATLPDLSDFNDNEIYSSKKNYLSKEILENYLIKASPENFNTVFRQPGWKSHVNFLIEKGNRELERQIINGNGVENSVDTVCAELAKLMNDFENSFFDEIYGNSTPRYLLPNLFEKAIAEYKLLATIKERTRFIEAFIEIVMFDWQFSGTLDSDLFKNAYSKEVLYYYGIGARLFVLGEFKEAQEYFKKIINIEPKPIDYLMLSKTYRALNEKVETFNTIKDGLTHFPNDFLLTLALSGTLYWMGETKLANETLEPVKKDFNTMYKSEIEGAKKLAVEISEAIKCDKIYRDQKNDIYDDKYTKKAWYQYWYHYNCFRPTQHPEAYMIDYIPRYLTSIAKDATITLKGVLDFGTLCAEPLYRFAKNNPEIQCVGIDRQDLVKELNDKAYSLNNLRFEAGDIFEYLEHFALLVPNHRMLFHCRTAVLCYPNFLLKLYKKCAELGIEYICLMESNSLSRDTLTFYNYGEMPNISIARRGSLINHDYFLLLEQSGYEIVKKDFHLAPHLLEDYAALIGSNTTLVAQLKLLTQSQ
ncbi:hypothetical protein SCY49_10060 [Legionella pneumophila serogroup 1]|nr:hypothetical protein [Legionella pneumophila]